MSDVFNPAGESDDDGARRARWLIEPAALAARLGDPSLVVLDAHVDLAPPRFDGDYRVVSGRDAWRAERIPGARHADLVEALSASHPQLNFMRPDPQVLARAIDELGVGGDSQVVVYDRADGFWAARLWWMRRWIGIDAQVLDGGWRAWRAAGLPVEAGGADEAGESGVSGVSGVSGDSGDSGDAPPFAGQTLPVRVRNGMWIDRDAVEAAVAGSMRGTLVCALSDAVFSGRVPSRYARRGHIPGSVNVPARTLFDAEGRYLPTAQLRAALASLDSAQPVLLYCGGGISAAVDALALTLIGRDDVAIYDGSLQEWAADLALPMATDG
ncbi:sulfurtransferase [Burkholderia sp. MR1-5-21]